MNVLGQLNFSMIFQSPSRLTVSKSHGHINKGRVEVAVLFHTFFLKLTGSKYHVGGSSASAEATLTFREKTLLQVVQQAVERDAGQDLACYGQEGDWLVVVAGLVMHHGQT